MLYLVVTDWYIPSVVKYKTTASPRQPLDVVDNQIIPRHTSVPDYTQISLSVLHTASHNDNRTQTSNLHHSSALKLWPGEADPEISIEK